MAEQYSLELAAKVICQLAESSGFGEGIQRSALDTLSELLVRYIAQAASGAAGLAELAGRTEITAVDLVSAACSLHGFSRQRMSSAEPAACACSCSPCRSWVRA